MTRRHPDIAINPDGSMTLHGDKISIPNIHVSRQIGTGANAVVFLGENPYLNREVAVKLWLPAARLGDRRDKFLQGICEARKVSSLEEPCIIRVYDAGEAATLFYLSMEYYPSVTLKDWLTAHHRPFQLRLLLATDILAVMSHAHHRGMFHGDLHTRNILIHEIDATYLHTFRRDNTKPVVDFRIIDFGTSYFTGSGFSLARHWRILEETLDALLSPLKMRRFWYDVARRPSRQTDSMMIDAWFWDYLWNLPAILEIAFTGDSCHKIRVRRKCKEQDRVYELREVQLSREGLAFLRSLKGSGLLSMEQVSDIFPGMATGAP